MCGRGWGKTRTGAETVRNYVETGVYGRIGLIAPTAADARDVMVEGESGLVNICPPWNKPLYEPSKRRVTWNNGALATLYSADEPERLRGPQHDFIWGDEPRSWRYPDAWDQAMLGLRLGVHPRWVATTTPSRTALIRKLLAIPGVHLTRGSTYDNRANLAEMFFQQIARQYEGTTLGRQELYAEMLDDVPGALWTRATIENNRRLVKPDEMKAFVQSLKRIVVGVDPAATSNEDSNDTGIIVAGVAANGHGFVLEDRTVKASPDGWGRRAVRAFDDYKANAIVPETNQGGEMVSAVLRTAAASEGIYISIKPVHASRGKRTRAEPIAALYEQGKIHHVGAFSALEDEMCSWLPGEDSPDRMDALVWALTDLMLDAPRVEVVQDNPFYG
jgi:predicted phage terminase large subunit-like protein